MKWRWRVCERPTAGLVPRRTCRTSRTCRTRRAGGLLRVGGKCGCLNECFALFLFSFFSRGKEGKSGSRGDSARVPAERRLRDASIAVRNRRCGLQMLGRSADASGAIMIYKSKLPYAQYRKAEPRKGRALECTERKASKKPTETRARMLHENREKAW